MINGYVIGNRFEGDNGEQGMVVRQSIYRTPLAVMEAITVEMYGDLYCGRFGSDVGYVHLYKRKTRRMQIRCQRNQNIGVSMPKL